MKKNITPKEWAEGFAEFTSSSEVSPPHEISQSVLSKVRSDLNPAIMLVAAKLAFIHVIIGTSTLLICPQFGVNLGSGLGLMALFMKYGAVACSVGCGVVFLAGSALTASLVLRPEEIRKIRQTKFLLIPALGTFSLGAFIMIGVEIVLGPALLWLLGSVIGGLLTLETGWRVRKRIFFGT